MLEFTALWQCCRGVAARHAPPAQESLSCLLVLLKRRVVCCVAVPAPPSLVTKVLNGSVIQATWEPSSKMGQHQGFRLYYRRAHTPHFAGPFTFPRNVSQHTITELGETRRFRRHPHACVTAPSRTSRLSLKESDPFLPPASEIGDQTGVVVPEEILSRG